MNHYDQIKISCLEKDINSNIRKENDNVINYINEKIENSILKYSEADFKKIKNKILNELREIEYYISTENINYINKHIKKIKDLLIL